VHVGINLVFLVPGAQGGMEVVARELLPELVEAAPDDWRFTAFVSRDAAADGDAPWNRLMPSVTVPVHPTSRGQWVRGEQVLLPRAAAREGVDLVHSLASTSPVRGPFRRVVTVHDLIYLVHPEAHGGLRALGMRVLVPLGVRRADRVTAVSETTKRDLVERLHVPEEKIDVVPNGVGAREVEPAPEREVRERLGLGGRDVVLSPSARLPHKNLPRLLEAWALLPAPRPLLALPGYPTPHEAHLRERARALGIEEDVRFLGWIAAADLEALYALSRCLVFPSLYEGFGLPVLEAMARGLPVACSNGGSLGEVAGPAALVFDPLDPRAIAAAVASLLDDPAEADRLRAAGCERAARYTWRESARLMLETYRRALS